MTIKDKVKHVMGLDRGKQAGDESGGIAHAYQDDRAGEIGGPEVGSTGEGRTTGHGSGATTSGATIGVGGLSAGNSGIHPGHRAALAKIDAEEAAKKKPAPVVEEPVKEPVKEVVVEKPVVVQEPVVERVSEPTYTHSTTPVNLSPVGDFPTTLPVGARVAGHSTIISGPHNPHLEGSHIDGSGLSATPTLGGSGVHHSQHTGLTGTSGYGHGAPTDSRSQQGITDKFASAVGLGGQSNQQRDTGTGSGYESGYGQGAQTDSSNQPGIASKVASAVGLGGGQQTGTGSNTGSNNYGSGSSTGYNQGASGYGQGAQTDSSNQPGIASKVASALGLGSGQQTGTHSNTGYNQGETGYNSGSSGSAGGNTGYNQGSTGHGTGGATSGETGYNSGRSTEGSGAPYGVQSANYPSSGASYGTSGSTGHTSTGGHGVNDNSGYGGNSGAGGVTDAQGNQLSGNPSARN